MGKVMTDAMQNGVPAENVWIVPYPYWVDTRLAPIWAGLPGRDIAKPREELPKTVNNPGPKVFMVKIEDVDAVALLQALYPLGQMQRFVSAYSVHDFWIYRVP